jgi:hypothetical protein
MSKYGVDYNTLPDTGGILSKSVIDKEYADVIDHASDKKNEMKIAYAI